MAIPCCPVSGAGAVASQVHHEPANVSTSDPTTSTGPPRKVRRTQRSTAAAQASADLVLATAQADEQDLDASRVTQPRMSLPVVEGETIGARLNKYFVTAKQAVGRATTAVSNVVDVQSRVAMRSATRATANLLRRRPAAQHSCTPSSHNPAPKALALRMRLNQKSSPESLGTADYANQQAAAASAAAAAGPRAAADAREGCSSQVDSQSPGSQCAPSSLGTLSSVGVHYGESVLRRRLCTKTSAHLESW